MAPLQNAKRENKIGTFALARTPMRPLKEAKKPFSYRSFAGL
jgi:hypothetical protein